MKQNQRSADVDRVFTSTPDCLKFYFEGLGSDGQQKDL